MLRWTAMDLAAASKVGVATIRRVEVVDGEIPVTLANEAAIIVFSMGTDKLHEHDLPTEVECSDQTIASFSETAVATNWLMLIPSALARRSAINALTVARF